MREKVVSMLLRALLLFTVIAFCAGPSRAQSAAEKLYKAKCAACHGPTGDGSTAVGKKLAAHDFRSPEVQKMSDDQLADVISKGKNKMPGYAKTLKPDDVQGLVAYIHELANKK
jgi:mono/diheme cytochrome c family protein